MGASSIIHIGPYLHVIGTVTTKSIKTKKSCNNHPDESILSKFCPKCGLETSEIEFISTDSLGPREFMFKNSLFDKTGLFEVDRLYSPEYIQGTFISNMESTPDEPNTINLQQNDLIDISIERIKNGKDWFINEFSKEIKIFEENFGKEYVKVCWGVINDYS